MDRSLHGRLRNAFNVRLFVFALLALCLIATWVKAFSVPLVGWAATGESELEASKRDRIERKSASDWLCGIVVDAGSSGSRVYLYRWLRHSGNPEELLKIEQMRDENGKALVKKKEPGISAYVDDPEKAFASLRPLLDFASSKIPQSSHRDSLLFVLATAGLRLLSQEKQDKLLHTLRLNIRRQYLFHLPDTHVEVLTGKVEGIYGWIAVNYVLGRFDHSHNLETSNNVRHGQQSTVGSLDLGGASAQIAHEVSDGSVLPASVRADINLGCDSHSTIHSHHLYVATLLGYGSNEALSKYHQFLLKEQRRSNSTIVAMMDPCLPLNRREIVTVKGSNRQLSLIGIGNFTACRHRLRTMLNHSVHCPRPPCSTPGIQQPRGSKRSEFYGVGEYWFTTDMAKLSGQYDIRKFEMAAKVYCHTQWSHLEQRYRSNVYPKHVGWDRLRLQCFKSAWLSVMLHDVYRFPHNSSLHLTTTNQIYQHTIQWTLGAILFKTRYLPLQEVQRHHGLKTSQHTKRTTNGIDGFHLALLLLAAIAVIGAVFYLRRRSKPSHRRIVSPHPRFLPQGRVFKFPHNEKV